MNTQNTQKLTREELRFCIKQNKALHTSVQPIERLKEFHFSIFIKYFSDKENGFIWNRMNTNGSWTWRWFDNYSDAVDYMNGHTLEYIKNKNK